MTFETVAIDTPACLAMSVKRGLTPEELVGLRPLFIFIVIIISRNFRFQKFHIENQFIWINVPCFNKHELKF